MIPGFNHNIKHGGRVFHVQTEDSGTKNPHIITHLFVGGNILASQKTKYDHLLGQGDHTEAVRELMQTQHKEMLRNLIQGKYDSVDTGKAYHLDGPAPLNVERGQLSASSPAVTGLAAKSESAHAQKTQVEAPAPVTLGAQQPVNAFGLPPAGSAQVDYQDPAESTDPQFKPSTSVAPWDAIKTQPGASTPPTAAASPEVSPFDQAAAASPFVRAKKKKAAAPAPRPLNAAPTDIRHPAEPQAPAAQAPPPTPPPPAPEQVPAEVMAARQLAAEEILVEKPARGDTIFGEDLVSEKSLDEVILSYLSDEGD